MYFAQCKNLSELKAEYKRLVMENHPDLGGDEETMKQINIEYDNRFKVLKNSQNAQAQDPESTVKKTTEAPEEFREIISQLIHMIGLEIELCGSWIWVGGNTLEHKDSLKALGFRWSKAKKLWHWHHAEAGQTWYRGHRSMDSIRETYGSQRFQVEEQARLSA